MFIGSWRRAPRTNGRQTARRPAQTPIQQLPASLPRGVADVEMETRLALTALEDIARARFVDLQMAIEPFLVAQADIDDCQQCLRALLAAAINRADSGVLITAVRHGDRVDVEILDDCTAEPASIHLPEPDGVPHGATVTAEFLAKQGVKTSLRLPYPQIDVLRDAQTWTLEVT